MRKQDNNIEAAEMLEANIEKVKAVFEKMNKLLEHYELAGTETEKNLSNLRENVQALKDTIALNEATAKVIRATAE